MNKVILIGHLGKDAEVKHTSGGKQLMNFTVATTNRWKDQEGKRQERTEWHRCTAWGDRWQGVLPYLHKGQRVCVEGEVRYREGETKDGAKSHYTDIHVEAIELVGAKRDDAAHQAKPLGKGKQQQAAQQMDLDDELPF
jgi:single-strand DNA-binding protein